MDQAEETNEVNKVSRFKSYALYCEIYFLDEMVGCRRLPRVI